MASSPTIPEPNASGYYSDELDPAWEEFLIKMIKETAPHQVDSSNAGELLFLIWAKAANLRRFSRRPQCFSSLQNCKDYVGQQPEMVSLLADVHEKRAYTWLCKHLTTTTALDSLPLEHTQVNQTTEDFNGMIDIFLSKCRPRMEELVEKAHDVPSFFPSWTPKSSIDEIFTKHISDLCIPAVSGGRPSLLLHELGKEGNLDTAQLSNIFSFAHHTVLINTSGSGKTRLLLEGLCHRWGFYIVSKPDTAGIGSGDLWQVMEALDKARDYQRAKTMNEAGTNADSAIKHVQESAKKCLAQLLLARLLILNLLFQVAGRATTKEHRRLWVLLQAYPKIFGEDVDIFTELTQLLRQTTTVDLKARIYQQYRQLAGLRQGVVNPNTNQVTTPPFFCVLDGVQNTVTQRLGEFMSSDNSTKHPILREIWNLWTTVLQPEQMRLVLSGTGIELQALNDTLSSSVFKEHPYHVKNDVGAFEDPGAHAEYIKRYVPAHWSEPRWAEFLTRTWAWLRGRYRSTSTLVSLILEAGFPCPHRTLDEYVEAFTDFRPTDGKEWTDSEPELPAHFEIKALINKLNFEKMNNMQASILCDVIYEQILYGGFTLDSFPNEARDAFVEYGFARHRKTHHTVIDEPLPILAALQWLYHHGTFSMHKCLCHDINKHQKRRNGFEAYLAFYMRVVFEKAPKLNEIFAFRSDFASRTDLAWQHHNFELVTVVDAQTKNPNVYLVTSSCGPASNVGFSAKSGKEVLEWISTNHNRFTFCFPPESFGPDLLFFIRSKKSLNLLLVTIQAKRHESVAKDTLIEGVRTVTPSWFWKSKDTKHLTADAAPFIAPDDAKFADQSQAILGNIPHGFKVEYADYPVLRIFASWPGEAELERTLEWKEEGRNRKSTRKNAQPIMTRESSMENSEDPDLHPLAALHLENFNNKAKELDARWFQGDLEHKLVGHFKRARDEEDPELPRKRANLGTHLEIE